MAIIKEFIFGDDRPFKSCHASTLLELEDGVTLASWFGGTHENNPDVAIWVSRREDGVWTKPVKAVDEENLAHWNPVLFERLDHSIILYYKVGVHEWYWYTRYIISKDGGKTWSEAKDLVPGDVGGRGPVKNKNYRLKDGTVLAPASVETKYRWDSFADISYDDGLTFTKSEYIPFDYTENREEDGTIQPTFWQSENGDVHVMMRSSWGYIARSDSKDGGKTWCKMYNCGLPNNNSGFDVAQLPNGILGLIYNPIGVNWGDRHPIVLTLSYDDGETWTDTLTLETEPGEYSYPAIVPIGEDSFGMTYTWKRERMVYCRCTVDDIKKAAGKK